MPKTILAYINEKYTNLSIGNSFTIDIDFLATYAKSEIIDTEELNYTLELLEKKRKGLKQKLVITFHAGTNQFASLLALYSNVQTTALHGGYSNEAPKDSDLAAFLDTINSFVKSSGILTLTVNYPLKVPHEKFSYMSNDFIKKHYCESIIHAKRIALRRAYSLIPPITQINGSLEQKAIKSLHKEVIEFQDVYTEIYALLSRNQQTQKLLSRTDSIMFSSKCQVDLLNIATTKKPLLNSPGSAIDGLTMTTDISGNPEDYSISSNNDTKMTTTKKSSHVFWYSVARSLNGKYWIINHWSGFSSANTSPPCYATKLDLSNNEKNLEFIEKKLSKSNAWKVFKGNVAVYYSYE